LTSHRSATGRCRRGSLEIKPIGGIARARRNALGRMRATYPRLKGIEPFFGFYDVHADCLDGLFRKRKRLPELLGLGRLAAAG
jgi:hypothetical protein